MSDLHFLNPWWLLGVTACLLLGAFGRRRRVEHSPWNQVLDARLAAALIRDRAVRRRFGVVELLWLLLALGMLALAGPSWNRQVPDELAQQAAIIVVLGNGNSMYSGDVAPNRNRAVKAKVQALRRLMPQASFSVIAYAGSAHLVVPLTRDASFFDLYLTPLEPDIMPTVTLPRSGLGQALELARQTAGSTPLPANVIIMTDSLSSAERADLLAFHQTFAALEVLVVGSGAGGPPRFAPAGLADADSAVPLDDFAALKDQGLNVTGLSTDDQDLAWLGQHIRGTQVQAQNADAQWHWQDAGYWLALAMLPFALLLHRRLRVLALPLMLLAGVHAPDARADWNDLWWTPDQQGQRALEDGDYPRAARKFVDPYRQGRAYYLAEDYPQAAAAFGRTNTAQGRFYLGNSLARQQHYQAALKAYRQALDMDPGLAQASANAKAVEAVLEALAKRPGERQRAEPGDNEVGSIRIDLTPRHHPEEETAPPVSSMGEAELDQWMVNVKTSPKDMLKALFLLQTQEPAQ
ncbi:VWA domain-containing protein [Pseudomonas sp. NPDC090755]|uniref:VWA domain-containing protein n=1 Tax=Pseudomonas sp. NPDC090755 TaxID=3364481 RepID=UPI00383A4F59